MLSESVDNFVVDFSVLSTHLRLSHICARRNTTAYLRIDERHDEYWQHVLSGDKHTRELRGAKGQPVPGVGQLKGLANCHHFVVALTSAHA